MSFFRTCRDHAIADVGKDPIAQSGLKTFFHAAILTRVKCQDRHPTTGLEAIRQASQKNVERGELLIDRDAYRLKHPTQREIFFIFTNSGNGLDRIGELCGAEKFSTREFHRDEFRIRLVGILAQDAFELCRIRASQPIGCAQAACRIHPHVQRTVMLKTESA